MCRYCFFLQSSRCVSNEQPCLETTVLYDDPLFLSSLFYFFYFIFSASIAFMFSDFSISFFNVLFQSFIKGRRKAIIYIYRNIIIYIPDQISRSVVSDSLRPHESQHTRPPCPSPTPGVH